MAKEALDREFTAETSLPEKARGLEKQPSPLEANLERIKKEIEQKSGLMHQLRARLRSGPNNGVSSRERQELFRKIEETESTIRQLEREALAIDARLRRN